VDVILGGGFAAATLDIVNAKVFWNLYAGRKPVLILQSVAAGLLVGLLFAFVARRSACRSR
jgi:hypothetical protein